MKSPDRSKAFSFAEWLCMWIAIFVAVLAIIVLLPYTKSDAAEIDMHKVMEIESKGNPLAHNKSEDGRGLFQINPVCLKDWNDLNPQDKHTPEDLWHPSINRKIAHWYMFFRIPQMLKHFGKPVTVDNMLIAWNAGIKYVKDDLPLPSRTREYLREYTGPKPPKKESNKVAGTLAGLFLIGFFGAVAVPKSKPKKRNTKKRSTRKTKKKIEDDWKVISNKSGHVHIKRKRMQAYGRQRNAKGQFV